MFQRTNQKDIEILAKHKEHSVSFKHANKSHCVATSAKVKPGRDPKPDIWSYAGRRDLGWKGSPGGHVLGWSDKLK